MGGHFLRNVLSLENDSVVIPAISSQNIILVVNSFLVGLYLFAVTYYLSSLFLDKKCSSYFDKKSKLLLGTSNIIYLCSGLTGLMILVNNNLARAFSIGAAIALIRFRVKLGPKSADSYILFAIACGIASGLNEMAMSWILALVYSLIFVPITFLVRRTLLKSPSRE